ncbi:DUF3046 domain-containing protein, partial [Mycobacterium tuberculosis]|nr:DUF3046 domain-containing protein [Mycobacterium tuberculosis]
PRSPRLGAAHRGLRSLRPGRGRRDPGHHPAGALGQDPRTPRRISVSAAGSQAVMRHTLYWTLMNEEFGEARAASLHTDLTLS